MFKRFNFSRLLWLYNSAGLTFSELFLVLANKIIYSFNHSFYFIQAKLMGRDPNVFYNYRRHLPRGIKPKGRCLLAYLPEAVHKEYFLGNVKYYFSNNGAPLCVLKALNELGYIVDVIDYQHTSFAPRRDYDLFFFHQYDIYDALKPGLGNNIKGLEFETTAYWKPMVEKIRRQIVYFKQRHNIALPEEQFNHFLWMEKNQEQVERVSKAADGIIVMGDQLAGSFKQLQNKNIKLIKSAVYPDRKFKKDISLGNLERGRKKFLFFGGGTDVMRKGLDVILDAFIGTDYELYMCINLPPLFEQIFKVTEQKNIHNLGYLKVGSKKFYDIISQCNFIIQLSVAEGVPGGVLETMKYGLIPVVSRECNIPEATDIGCLLPEVTVEAVKRAVESVSGLSAETLQKKAESTIHTIQTIYSPEVFTQDIKKAVIGIIL
jgi:hypothetical protein